jgi:hypothetical protein
MPRLSQLWKVDQDLRLSLEHRQISRIGGERMFHKHSGQSMEL